TPLQNNLQELWALLNFMDPTHFASLEAFQRRFGEIQESRQVAALHTALKPYLLRRLKSDVEQALPSRLETLVECQMAEMQKKVYRSLFEHNFDHLQMGCKQKNFANFTNLMMELRKCCNHPYLIRGVEEAGVEARPVPLSDNKAMSDDLVKVCGKLQLLDKLLAKLHAGGHKVLIFSQMTRVLDILEDYCTGRRYMYERLDGSVSGRERQAAIDRFTDSASERFIFLLSTKAGGVGINLVAADTCIIFDSDWNPQNDAQALARCHRIGQTQQVHVYRLLMAKTYERRMLDTASRKLGLERAIFGGLDVSEGSEGSTGTTSAEARAEIENLLRHGAYGAFLQVP
ncbi:hypothetical protein CYMTET_31992, partial [Cymbomonas tetramitiformis]